MLKPEQGGEEVSWQCCAFLRGERSINRDAPPQVPATTARPGGLVGRSMLGLRTVSEAAGVVAEPRECIGGILQATCKVAYKPNKSPEWQRASSQTKGGRVAMPSIEDPEVNTLLNKVRQSRMHAFARSPAHTCRSPCPCAPPSILPHHFPSLCLEFFFSGISNLRIRSFQHYTKAVCGESCRSAMCPVLPPRAITTRTPLPIV